MVEGILCVGEEITHGEEDAAEEEEGSYSGSGVVAEGEEEEEAAYCCDDYEEFAWVVEWVLFVSGWWWVDSVGAVSWEVWHIALYWGFDGTKVSSSLSTSAELLS